MHERFGKHAQAGVAQRGAGGHHVGDEVGHAQLHRGLHGTVEVDGLGLDAVRHQIVVYELIECGGHALALNILQSGDRGFVRCGETEGRGTKAERHVLERGGTGVLE